MVRVGETLKITYDGEATLVYPTAVGVEIASLTVCVDDESNASGMQNTARYINNGRFYGYYCWQATSDQKS